MSTVIALRLDHKIPSGMTGKQYVNSQKRTSFWHGVGAAILFVTALSIFAKIAKRMGLFTFKSGLTVVHRLPLVANT